MIDLTVGQVSGLIATGVFALQMLLPLAIPAILIAFVSQENSVVTWSVLGRFLHSSRWPSILGTDTAAREGVNRRVNVTSWLQTAALMLLSLASIVTPLGLYQSIGPARTQTKEPFAYLRDSSAFGYGTPSRSDAPFTRVCWDAYGNNMACPGSTLNQTCQTIGSNGVQNCSLQYNSEIPEDLRDLFTNGATTFSPTASSVFDIQWRTYVNSTDGFSKLGWYLEGTIRQVSILILDESIQLVEGLIVDMDTGGIGFRNHTAPVPPLEYGSSWTEDILFVQPETQCVNLNVTLDFTLPYDNTDNNYVDNFVLTDRGGFSALSNASPNIYQYPNGQDNLDLKDRAYTAAWYNNFLTMLYFNVTNLDMSSVDVVEGATFPLSSVYNDSWKTGINQIQSTLNFGEYLNINSTGGSNQSSGTNQSSSTVNPFGISAGNFSSITNACIGTTAYSPANINSTVVGCGLLYGAASRTDGGSFLIPQGGSPWSVPIYSCASAVQATVRTVTFQYNGTGLQALDVTTTQPKTYQDSSSMPLWGVEDIEASLISGTPPIWGILGTSNSSNNPTESFYNISTLTQGSLYLPGYLDQYYVFLNGDIVPVDGETGQNLPGVDFYVHSLFFAFSVGPPDTDGYQIADYSGVTSVALFGKWQQLSNTADGAAQIIDLVWTDIAANTIVGTRGWGLTSAAAAEPNPVKKRSIYQNNTTETLVPITVYQRNIQYHLPYAIPAFIILAATLVIILTASTLTVMGRTGLRRMRKVLEATSAGRIMGIFLWPQKAAGKGTKEWIKAVGVRDAKVTPEYISAEIEMPVTKPKQADAESSTKQVTATAEAHKSGILGAEGEHLLHEAEEGNEGEPKQLRRRVVP